MFSNIVLVAVFFFFFVFTECTNAWSIIYIYAYTQTCRESKVCCLCHCYHNCTPHISGKHYRRFIFFKEITQCVECSCPN